MAIERVSGTSLVDVLERVLDKGVVIDATLRVWLLLTGWWPGTESSRRHADSDPILWTVANGWRPVPGQLGPWHGSARFRHRRVPLRGLVRGCGRP
jgi:hypothetical protein